MVEAPRIRIIYENIKFTKGKKIKYASGASYRKIGINLENYVIKKWWYAGKYIYTYLVNENSKPYVIRTHTMMYGKITTQPPNNPKLIPFLRLEFEDETILTWYLTQIKILDPNCTTDLLKTNYHSCTSMQAIKESMTMMKYDLSNKAFDQKLFDKHIDIGVKKHANEIIVDFLLDQEYFPGIGNILQQEALYRCKINPLQLVKDLGMKKIDCLVSALKEVIAALYESYINKLVGNPHQPIFQIYHKGFCPLGHKTITKYLGYHNRRTTWCPICQK